MTPPPQLLPVSEASGHASTDRLRVPSYDRSSLRVGMAHIGVGNFHRAHQAVYLDDLLHARADQSSWAYQGISLLDEASSVSRARAMREQDCLYTLTEFAPDGSVESRLVGGIVDYLHAPADPGAVVRRLTDPAIRIVSLTVSEGGYDLDEATGRFRIAAPHNAADLVAEHPRSTWGVLVRALAARRAAGVDPFTVLSCDNLRSNGDTARRATVGFAEGVDPQLAAWIEGNVAFPNSMVDRIAPAVDGALRRRLNDITGVADAVPVAGESFRQWVIEDEFPTGRPAWEDCGVQLRPDVAAFEAIKGRMLNASHVIMCYPSLLAGYELVNDAARDHLIQRLIYAFMNRDSMPLISPPSDVSLADYRDSVVARFTNPALPDTLLRVASDGASKIPVFHRATTEQLIAAGGDTRRPALLVASYRRYLHGVADTGLRFEPLEPKLTDADRSLLRSDDPLDALRASPFSGWGLSDSERFVADYLAVATTMQASGIRAAVELSLCE